MTSWRDSSRSMEPVWIALAALLAISPLLVHGTSCGHDLSFHLLNWMEVASQWKHGVLRPFWCYPAAWNAGEPRFVFYPPLSWTLGAALSLVLPIALVPTAYVFTALTLCGLTMRRLLRDMVTPQVALLVSCVYLANPYALFTAFERSAYAELLAAAWMPLLLQGVLRRKTSVLPVAVPVALLWLTNAPAAVAGSYALLIAGTFRCVQVWRSERGKAATGFAIRMVLGYALGLCGAALFLLPALVQRRWVQVQMAVLPGLRPADNFIFTHSGQPEHDMVLHQASLIAAGILGVGMLCVALLAWRRAGHVTWHSMHDRQISTERKITVPNNEIALALGLLLVLILFLLTPASSLVWKYAPELNFLQFPWRLLAVGTAAVAVLLSLMLRSAKVPRTSCIVAGLLFALAAGWSAHALYFQPCDDEDSPSSQQAIFRQHTGSEPTDEYTPASADNDALERDLPAAWTTSSEDGPPSAGHIVPDTGERDGSKRFVVQASGNTGYLVVRLRSFYGWHVSADGAEMPVLSQRNDGLLAIPLAPGTHHVMVQYRSTWDEVLGLLLSFISAAGMLWLFFRRERQSPPSSTQAEGQARSIP